VKLFTGLAVPGWVICFARIILLQAVTLSVIATLMTLANLSAFAFIPAIHALAFIKHVQEVKAHG